MGEHSFPKARNIFVLLALSLIALESRAQPASEAEARKVLQDVGLVETQPGVWELTGTSPTFAQRKIRLLKTKRDVRSALQRLGAKIASPKVQKQPEFSESEPIETGSDSKTATNSAQTPPKPGHAPPTVVKSPTKEAQKEFLAELKEIFAVEYEEAVDDSTRANLAKTLMEFADEESNNVAKYVLLREATKLYLAANDLQNTFRSIHKLCQAFPDENRLRYQYYALKNIADQSRTTNDSSDLGTHLNSTIDNAIEADQFDWALKTATVGKEAAEAARDRKQTKEWDKRIEHLSKRQEQFIQVQEATKTLATSPEDPDAHQIVGEYLIFHKSDWEKGLPHLAKGSDPKLKAVANAEKTEATDAKSLTAIGDGYWDILQTLEQQPAEDGDFFLAIKQTVMGQRCLFWYQKAKPLTTGIAKKKVSDRIDQLTPEAEDHSEPEEDNAKQNKKQIADANKNVPKKLSRKKKFLVDEKPKRFDAPKNPAGIPLWSRKGNVLYGQTPVVIPGKKNLYLHPYSNPGRSELTYDLRGRFRSFSGAVGIPGIPNFFGGARSYVSWYVSRDGKEIKIHESGRMGGKQAKFSLDVTGVKELKIVTTCSGRMEGCFAFWYAPLLDPSPTDQEIIPDRRNAIDPRNRIPGNLIPPGVIENIRRPDTGR